MFTATNTACQGAKRRGAKGRKTRTFTRTFRLAAQHNGIRYTVRRLGDAGAGAATVEHTTLHSAGKLPYSTISYQHNALAHIGPADGDSGFYVQHADGKHQVPPPSGRRYWQELEAALQWGGTWMLCVHHGKGRTTRRTYGSLRAAVSAAQVAAGAEMHWFKPSASGQGKPGAQVGRRVAGT